MRISREQMFMDIAETVAKRSVCIRNNVGAIITTPTNNIVSIGYNGPAPGKPHCTNQTCLGRGCSIAIHAEVNALSRLDKSLLHCTLYTTLSPCINCARKIAISCQIDCVYYRYEYRDLSGLDLLVSSGIEVYKILPSGEVLKYENSSNK